MAKIHLISGPVGAGKTTFSLNLKKETGAVHFSIDEWMVTLFGKDSPATPSLEWALERTARCEAQIWSLLRQLLVLNTDVILDLGFFKKEHRDQFRKMALQEGFELEFYYLTADINLRRQRVRERNKGKSETYTVDVSDGIFDWAESWYEVPDATELASAHVIST